MNKDEKDRRFAMLRQLGCIACLIDGTMIAGKSEIHHLNMGGHAGMARLGDFYTVPLCSHHHRGEPLPGKTATEMTVIYGPSLARESKRFRNRYGSDEALLERVNIWLRTQAV